METARELATWWAGFATGGITVILSLTYAGARNNSSKDE
jgi:hypothetical protein